MKYLIQILFSLITIHLSAQDYSLINPITSHQESTSSSIMFQHNQPSLPTPQWIVSMEQKKKRVVFSPTVKGVIVGALVGGLIAIPIQKAVNQFKSFFLWQDIEQLDHKYTVIGIGIGAGFGGIMVGITQQTRSRTP